MKKIDFVGVGLVILTMVMSSFLVFSIANIFSEMNKNNKIVSVFDFANNLSEVQDFKSGLDSWSIQYDFYSKDEALEKQEKYPVVFNCSRLSCDEGLHKILYYSKDGKGLLVVIQPDFKEYMSFSWAGIQINL